MVSLRLLPLLITLMLPAMASAMSPEEVPNPRERGEWIADEAGLLDSSHHKSINRALTHLEAHTGIEIAVVTVRSVDSPTPKDFTTELFNLWGIGKADLDNGLLIVLVTGERRLEMETGYGLEGVLTDGWLKTMQEREMVPRFREGDFAGGLKDGIFAVDRRLREDPLEFIDSEGDDNLSASSTRSPSLPKIPLWGWLLGVFGVVGCTAAARYKWMRTCPKCKGTMRLLEEHEEDDHLEGGKQTEESIGSISYDVYECQSCGDLRIQGISHWFSGFAACPDCSHRTLKSHHDVIQKPTYTSTGIKEVIVRCAHCDHLSRTRVTLPRLTHASSSSSGGGISGGGGGGFSGGGGGGSFGGGSSGGGGAGSSW
ncbi:TPM domain-containing protein [Lujinxingia vulgaris]|uniref:TPM domain-containing protein n=1 Tax=Lujinxingia vulgaris TaxID=2600176 RepID=A0A5C6XAJ2_9DELT|nr:TPM domain-containing protein [Lujinxingia vulgaris]TXD37480.1 TPM domain-containing protein [Lujinxingia vulgaris]